MAEAAASVPTAAGSSNQQQQQQQQPSNNGATAAIVHSDNPNAEVIRGQIFEVGPRYRHLSYIGEGAYGMVV